MTARPKGVTLVAVLTLLSSGAMLYFFLLMIALLSVGRYFNPLTTWEMLSALTPLCLSSFAFAFAVGMLKGARIAWYGSMVFWVLVLLYFGWFAWFVGSNLTFAQSYEYQIALALVVPLIYGVACLAYFWTNGVRKYFRVKT